MPLAFLGKKEGELGIIAVYSPKGGVGKTTISVDLAWRFATMGNMRTLLLDLDTQGGSGFMLDVGEHAFANAWDIAAGMLIAQEAGGKFRPIIGDFDLFEPNFIASSSTELGNQIFRTIDISE